MLICFDINLCVMLSEVAQKLSNTLSKEGFCCKLSSPPPSFPNQALIISLKKTNKQTKMMFSNPPPPPSSISSEYRSSDLFRVGIDIFCSYLLGEHAPVV